MRAAWQPAGARRTLYPAPEARWCAPEGRCTAICAWYCAMPRGAPAEYEPARMAPESSSPLRRQSACRPGPRAGTRLRRPVFEFGVFRGWGAQSRPRKTEVAFCEDHFDLQPVGKVERSNAPHGAVRSGAAASTRTRGARGTPAGIRRCGRHTGQRHAGDC